MRQKSYGQGKKLRTLDIIGGYLSQKNFKKYLTEKYYNGALLDVGSGWDARVSKPFRNKFHTCYLADLALNPELLRSAKNKTFLLEGDIASTIQTFPAQSVKFILANNVIEHLDEPEILMKEFKRIIEPTGYIYINVPSWRGKFFLELAAFKLGLAPQEEMQDHKNYFSKSELWTLIRGAKFNPRAISVYSKKFGLNTLAIIEMQKS
jgi:SAM-dependent methyltransferase